MIWVIKKMGGDRPNSQPDDVSISFRAVAKKSDRVRLKR